jgi:ribosomal RNA-processing protein 17
VGLLEVRERDFSGAVLIRAQTGGDEWGVSSGPEGLEEEYEGEEQLATVTVVHDFDLSALPGPVRDAAKDTGRAVVKPTPRPRPKKVRYEGKAARLAERRKQRARRTEKAERARR